ncbi:hypothetical protein ACWDTP_23880, partial [Mycobacterium sp. NPDC003449]
AARVAKRCNMRELAPLVVLSPGGPTSMIGEPKGPKESVATNHGRVGFRDGKQRANTSRNIAVRSTLEEGCE